MLAFLLVSFASAGKPAAPPPGPPPAATPPAAAPVAPTRPGVPIHDLSVLDGCTDEELAFTIGSIADAIDVGAPVYNSGNTAGCYHLYLGTAIDISQRLSSCSGVRNALLAGTTRAAAQRGYPEQAWAMRDAFDGLLYVFERKLAATKAAAGDKTTPL
jgi:hypothetical protein